MFATESYTLAMCTTVFTIMEHKTINEVTDLIIIHPITSVNKFGVIKDGDLLLLSDSVFIMWKSECTIGIEIIESCCNYLRIKDTFISNLHRVKAHVPYSVMYFAGERFY